MENTTVYVNGSWQSLNEASVPFTDAGFLYGDGLFETLRFQNGGLFRPEKHLERLRSGTEILKLNIRQSNDELLSLLKEAVARNQLTQGALRLMITRGFIHDAPWLHEGPNGLYILVRSVAPKPENPVEVMFLNESDYPLIRFRHAIKSMNYIGNLLAKKTVNDAGAYEPVFVNRRGLITECAIRNIFFIKDGVLLTPDLKLGVLPGVMRDTIMQVAHDSGMSVWETHIPLQSLDNMDEAFISSTSIGMLPCYWEKWRSDYHLTKILDRKLEETITACVENEK